MDNSMMFLRVRNWDNLLEWMESVEVLNCKLQAYRDTCSLATSSLRNKNVDKESHMIARITMNGFVQMHLMWNAHQDQRYSSGVQKNKGRERDAECRGIQWTSDVDKMVKLRMGLVMAVIEILS
jgi:hypothetical protein